MSFFKEVFVKAKIACFGLSLIAAACGSGAATTGTSSSSSSSSSGAGGGASHDPPGIPGCARTKMETDLKAGALAGPGVDASGALKPLPKGAYVSSTYLAIKTDAATQKQFQGLATKVIGVLASTPGLLAFSVGISQSCSTARTLSVWQDEASMVKFSVGPEHAAAAAAIDQLSRGGSIVTAWAASDVHEASWDYALTQLGDATGPFL